MRRKLLLLTGILLFAFGLRAQYPVMGLHLSAGFASEENSVRSDATIGGGINFDYYFNDYVNLGLEFGYLGFAFDTSNVAVTILPLQLKLEGHLPLSESFDVYAGTGAGMFIARYVDPVANFETQTIWGLTPRAGFRFQFSPNVWLDLSGRYAYTLSEVSPDDVSGIVTFNIGISYNVGAEL